MQRPIQHVAALCILAAVAGCGDDDAMPGDSGPLPIDARVPEAGGRDAGPPVGIDAGPPLDAGPGTLDSGIRSDGGAGGIDAGPRDGGPPWQYASSATATSFFPAGDCAEVGDYDPPRSVGAPDCTDCLDYCPMGKGGTSGATPCSWFSSATGANALTVTFATPIMATGVRVWATYTAPAGDITEVAVAATAAGPFTALTAGMPGGATCGSPRGPDDYTLTFALPGTAVVGAVRVSVSDLNTGVDAVGIR